jgi:hypothetical protein
MRKFVLTSFVSILAFTSMASAQFPGRASVQVTGVISGGAGCPQGTVQVVMAPDGSSFTVLYDQLQLQASPSQPIGAMDCTVTINLRKPLLMGFGIESVDFRGFVGLDRGVAAEQRVSVTSGAVKGIREISTEFSTQTWRGPLRQNYTMTTVRPLQGLEILNCLPPRENTKIVIKSRLRMQVQHGHGEGLLTVDSTDGKMAQKYHLRWQNCANDIGNVIGGILGGLARR